MTPDRPSAPKTEARLGPVIPRGFQARTPLAARACQGAPLIASFLMALAIPTFYSAAVIGSLHIGARLAMVAFAALLTWFSLGRLWGWVVGGRAELWLDADPVPHGREVPLKFTLARQVQGREWSVKVSLMGAREDSSGFGSQWSETFVARPTGSRELAASIFIPAHLMPTSAGAAGDCHIAMLKLGSGRLDWMFHLRTGPEPPR